MKKFYKLYLIFLLRLHSHLYFKISQLSSKLNYNIHPKHKITNYHQFFIKNIENNSKILDIGCGNGILTYELANKAKKVVAIDFNKNSIKIAKQKFSQDNITYITGDATKYNFNEKFDYIILSNVLEHIKNRHSFLNKFKQSTKYFLIRVPMINRSWLTLYKKKIGLEYRLDNSHYIEYTLKSFKKEIELSGLTIKFYSIQFGEIWSIVGV